MEQCNVCLKRFLRGEDEAMENLLQEILTLSSEEKQNLGELLYLKVKKIEPVLAPKITGMLLELDAPTIKYITQNNGPLLKEKVQEALVVLKRQYGEEIFYKVETLEPLLAPKITGMLLECQCSELQTLLQGEFMLRSYIKQAKFYLQLSKYKPNVEEEKHFIGRKLHSFVQQHERLLAPEITRFMLVMFSMIELSEIVANKHELRAKVQETKMAVAKLLLQRGTDDAVVPTS